MFQSSCGNPVQEISLTVEISVTVYVALRTMKNYHDPNTIYLYATNLQTKGKLYYSCGTFNCRDGFYCGSSHHKSTDTIKNA